MLLKGDAPRGRPSAGSKGAQMENRKFLRSLYDVLNRYQIAPEGNPECARSQFKFGDAVLDAAGADFSPFEKMQMRSDQRSWIKRVNGERPYGWDVVSWKGGEPSVSGLEGFFMEVVRESDADLQADIKRAFDVGQWVSRDVLVAALAQQTAAFIRGDRLDLECDLARRCLKIEEGRETEAGGLYAQNRQGDDTRTSQHGALNDSPSAIAGMLGVILYDSYADSLSSKPFTGREWLDKQLFDWFSSGDSAQICLIEAGIGLGKSMYLAHLLRTGGELAGRIAASFFCIRGREAYNSPSNVVRSLAYQLACKVPKYRIRLQEILNGAPKLDSLDGDTLFALLLSEPISTLFDHDTPCMAIVIDGIDEADNAVGNPLSSLLGRNIRFLPKWLKFLVTSRPSPAATIPFEFGTQVLKVSIDGESEDNRNDLRAHLYSLFDGHFPVSSVDGIVSALVDASKGSFLYAELMADAVLNKDVDLKVAIATLPTDLSGMYLRWFELSFPITNEYNERYRKALGCILVARDGVLPVSEYGVLFDWDENDIDDFVSRVGALLSVRKRMAFEDSVSFNHSFIAQWVSGEGAGRYRSRPEAARKFMAKRYSAIAAEGYDQLTDYEIRELPYLLEASGMIEDSSKLLMNPVFVERSLNLAESLGERAGVAEEIALLEELVGRTEALCPDGIGYLAEECERLAASYCQAHRLSESREAYEKALATYRELWMQDESGRQYDVLRVLGELEMVLATAGDIHEAAKRSEERLELLDRLLEVDRGCSIWLSPAQYWYSVAGEHQRLFKYLAMLGDVDAARKEWSEAVSLAELVAENAEKGSSIEAYAHLNLGFLQGHDECGGDLHIAEDELRRGIAILRALKDNHSHSSYLLVDIGKSYREIARFKLRAGSYDEAAIEYREAGSAYLSYAEIDGKLLPSMAAAYALLGGLFGRAKCEDKEGEMLLASYRLFNEYRNYGFSDYEFDIERMSEYIEMLIGSYPSIWATLHVERVIELENKIIPLILGIDRSTALSEPDSIVDGLLQELGSLLKTLIEQFDIVFDETDSYDSTFETDY